MPTTHCGVFSVGDHLVGVAVANVQEMFVLPEVHAPPNRAPAVRGLLRLRESVLPVIDLRVCLGLASSTVELEKLIELLAMREKDHLDWIDELERSTREARAFTLARDPHQCKFGVWYDAFRTDNGVLRTELARFGEPHARIHALAQEVEGLKATGRTDDALAVVDGARVGVLGELRATFASVGDVMRREHREVGVTVLLGSQRVVMVVDAAEVVAELDDVAEHDDPIRGDALRTPVVSRLLRWKGSPRPVLLLDLATLGQTAAAPAAVAATADCVG
jgi:purine-binding chemotaxis protein CheW